MARPLRDDPTRTAQSGDSVRALTRFTDGYDWLDRGTDAMVRAGTDIGAVIADRVRRQDGLADAAAMTQAKTDARLRIDERVRQLDARDPEYRSRVEGIADEELRRAIDGAKLSLSSSRPRLEMDLAPLRGQAILSAMDRRERAIIDDARQQATVAINRAAAAAATGGSPGQVMLNLEAELAPVLAAVDPQVRDAILLTARSTVAGEAVKSLVDRRDFAGAEAMLRTYGQSGGILSPQDIRAVRAGIEREKRQAAAEEKLNQRVREADLRDAVAMAASPEEAQQVLDDALRAGMIRPGSPLARALDRQISVARRASEDRMFGVFQEGRARVLNAIPFTPQAEAEYLAAVESVAAQQAVRDLRQQDPGATPEQVMQARGEAARRARETAVQEMLEMNPGVLPHAIEAQGRRVLLRGTPEQRAGFAEWLGRNARLADGTMAPSAQKFLSDHDPVTALAVEDLIARRQPVTAAALMEEAPFRNATPETVTARRNEWQQSTRGDKPMIRPRELIAQALRSLPGGSNVAFPPDVMDVAVQHMRVAFESGRVNTPQEAAAVAAQLVSAQHPPNPLAPGQRIRADANPAVAVPRRLYDQFGTELVNGAIRDRLKTLADAAAAAANARFPNRTPLTGADIELVPVAEYREGRPVGIGLYFKSRRDPTGLRYRLTDASGRAWFMLTTDADVLAADLRLEERAAEMARVPALLRQGRTLLEQEREARRAAEEAARSARLRQAVEGDPSLTPAERDAALAAPARGSSAPSWLLNLLPPANPPAPAPGAGFGVTE